VAFCTVHTDWMYCGLWQCPGDFALNESVHLISSLGLFSSLPLTLFISCLCSVPSFLAERTTGCLAHGCSVGPGCWFVGWLRVVLGVWWGMISPPSLRQFLLSLGFFALGSSVRFFFSFFPLFSLDSSSFWCGCSVIETNKWYVSFRRRDFTSFCTSTSLYFALMYKLYN